MVKYLGARLAGAVMVVFVVSIVTFLIFQIAPLLSNTSPVYYYVGRVPPSAEAVQLLEHRYGFDLPLPQQYGNWVRGVIFGQVVDDGTGAEVRCDAPCLGYSFRQQLPVRTMILDALPVSLGLVAGAAVLWLVIGITVGTVSALRRGSLLDRAGMVFALGGVSAPIFVTGPLLLLVFSYQLGWLPDTSYVSLTSDPLQWLRSMVLPWIALAVLFAALYARLTRANMLETMNEDFIRTARAKGLRRREVVVRHGLRAAITPILSVLGVDLGTLLGSAVITETVFNLNGLGKLSVDAVRSEDLPVLMGVTIVVALAVVLVNLVVDILYAVADPRVGDAR